MKQQARWSEADGGNSRTVDEQLFQKKRQLPTWATNDASTNPGPSARTGNRQPGPATRKQPFVSGSQPGSHSTPNNQPSASGSHGQASTSTSRSQAPTSQSRARPARPAQDVPLPPSPPTKKRKRMHDISEEALGQLSKQELKKVHNALIRSLQDLEAGEEGDTEDDGPRPSQPRRRKRIQGGPPKPKHPERNRLVHDVHEYAHILFGLAGPAGNQRLPPSPDFPDRPPPSDTHNFRYAWNKSRSHHFNQGAANCFARAMIDLGDYEYGQGRFEDLKEAFLTYADRTLRKRWKRERSGGTDSYDLFSRKRADSARSRRRRLFYDRRKVLSTVRSLSPWLVLLDALGIDGMSSDDEDFSGAEGRRYIIAQKTWHSAEVKMFLRTLDELFTELKLEKRGQDRRIRVESATRSSHTEAVGGLPANCYDEDWLEGTPEWKLELFGIQMDQEANFTLPEWVNGVLAEKGGNAGGSGGPRITRDEDGDHAMQGGGSGTS